MTDNQQTTSTYQAEPDQLRLPVDRAEEEVGIQLRQARLKRRLGLEQVATRLKLSRSTLERMEKGELDQLAPLYRRGYVRNYAEFLGLDPEPLLELVEQTEPAAMRQVLSQPRRAPRFDRYLKIGTYLIVTTLIVPPLVLLYIQGGSRFIDSETTLVDDAPASVAGAVEQRNASRIARALALEESQESDPEDTRTAPMAASTLPLSAIRPLRDPALLETGADELVAEAESPLDDGRSVLVIELLEDSWLEVYSGAGERLEYDLLRAGEQRRFEAEPPFRLLLGRANAIALELDGEAVEFDGQDRADVTSLELLAGGEARL